MRRPWVALLFAYCAGAMGYEEPEYVVVDARGDYEVRQYESFVVAETDVDGGFDESGNTAFRRLTGYIFGGNSRSGESVKMNMTVPVTLHESDAADDG